MVNSIIGQKLSVREVESTIKNIKEDNQPTIYKEVVKSYDFSKIKSKLNVLGLKTSSSKNKLTIEFVSETQIEEFLNNFSK